ncbi:MAG: hypothetical protein JST39_20715, partial [Bacteroidetes bacterium]|nr:hypothetical protein [Bacteroidota bacterium]
FTETFIGTSEYSKRCVLTNPEALRFHYSKSTSELSAYATEPLIFTNSALGYIIRVDLAGYRYSQNTHYLYFKIYPFFQEMQSETAADAKRWKKNRQYVYTGSQMHFLRSLYRHRSAQEGFEISTTDIKISPDNQSIQTKTTRLVSDTEILHAADTAMAILYFFQPLEVVYKNKTEPVEYLQATGRGQSYNMITRSQSSTPAEPVRSSMELTDRQPMPVFSNGAIYDSNLLVRGFLAWWNKMATMLPLDYDPAK